MFGTGGEAVGGVLYITAGDDGAFGGFEEEGCAYAEVAVGGVGVLGCGEGVLVELGDLAGGERHLKVRLLGGRVEGKLAEGGSWYGEKSR